MTDARYIQRKKKLITPATRHLFFLMRMSFFFLPGIILLQLSSIGYIIRYIQVIRSKKKQIELFARATIIPILLTSDKTIMSLSYENQIFWPVYIIINNLDIKMHQS